MNGRHEGFCETARLVGWTCEPGKFELGRSELPLVRYPWLSDEYLCFLESVGLCVSADETCWLLTARDFVVVIPTMHSDGTNLKGCLWMPLRGAQS